MEQKEKTEKIIADKDLFNSIYSNKVNVWEIIFEKIKNFSWGNYFFNINNTNRI